MIGTPGTPRRTLSAAANYEDLNYNYSTTFTATPLLTAAEEVALAHRITAGLSAKKILTSGEKLTTAQIRKHKETMLDGDKAHEQFMLANTLLVMRIARGFIRRGLPYQDLVSEGTLGLAHAIRKFDPSRGFRFSTYATPWIKQYIGRAINNQADMIRIPEHRLAEIYKVNSARRIIENEQDTAATREQIAAKTGFAVDHVAYLDSLERNPMSLSTPVGDDDGATYGDFILDEGRNDPENVVVGTAMADAVKGILASTTDKERQVLQMRFGFEGDPMSLEAIAKVMGLSRERVRQIEVSALGKLRHPAHNHLREFIAA